MVFKKDNLLVILNILNMEKIPTQSNFESKMKERFARQPISFEVLEQVFNLVQGGYHAVDNANLNEDEIKIIINKVQDIVRVSDETGKPLDSKIIHSVAKEVDLIIDAALDR